MTISQIEKGIQQLEIKDQLQLLSWFMQYVRQQVLCLISTTDKDEEVVSLPAVHESYNIDDDPFLNLFDEQDVLSSKVETVDRNVNHMIVEAVDHSQPQFLENDPIVGMFSGPATLSQDVKEIVQQGLVEGSGLTWKK